MYFDFATVLVYLLVSVGFVVGSLVFGSIIRANKPTPEKESVYECGEETIGTAWIQFNVRFYIIALIFLIFDVEIAALFPWTTIWKEYGGLAMAEMAVFILILVVGLVYDWAKKALFL